MKNKYGTEMLAVFVNLMQARLTWEGAVSSGEGLCQIDLQASLCRGEDFLG